MANPEHLEILKQGVDVWNHWRNGYLSVSLADIYGRKQEIPILVTVDELKDKKCLASIVEARDDNG